MPSSKITVQARKIQSQIQTDASVHLYDATSTVSEMSIPNEVHRQIQNQITKLKAEPDASICENHTGEANKE